MSNIILHHYPPSLVSEKLRLALGLKQLTWSSVEQNRLPDRPELFAMNGGYRRVPVMQIGADIYCDTQCILRELERRVPSPTFYPDKDTGLPFALSRWVDDPLFKLVVRCAFAPVAHTLPPELVADRTRLYFGLDGDMEKEATDIPHTLAQLRAQFGWLEESLTAKGDYFSGSQAGMNDLLVAYIVWFFSGRFAAAEAFMSEFPGLVSWFDRMQSIGHGSFTDMSTEDALRVALEHEPKTVEQCDVMDPQGLAPGMSIEVGPLTDSGETPVSGTLLSVDRYTVVVSRSHALCGNVAVHFPRVGYRVTEIK